jgi:hypothetical protein
VRTIVLAGLAFGAADQYLGTTHVLVHTGVWPVAVSNMSALWLILPFVAGWAQPSRKRAVVAGTGATAAAFLGYFAMTLSPLEGVSAAHALHGIAPLVAGQARWLAGAAVGAPVYAVLGFRWRTGRSWLSAGAVAGALCLEPFAWMLSGVGLRVSDARGVWTAEVAAGVVAAGAFAIARRRSSG